MHFLLHHPVFRLLQLNAPQLSAIPYPFTLNSINETYLDDFRNFSRLFFQPFSDSPLITQFSRQMHGNRLMGFKQRLLACLMLVFLKRLLCKKVWKWKVITSSVEIKRCAVDDFNVDMEKNSFLVITYASIRLF